MQRYAWASGLVLSIGLVLGSVPAAHAVITRLTPLKEVLSGEQLIFMARVESVDPAKPSLVLTVGEALKGKVPFGRLPINLTGDSDAQKDKHTAQLLKRVAPNLPLVVFASKRGKKYTGFGYTNGTWFQMAGYPDEADATKVRWAFLHCEPYLRRTFKGTTTELRQVIIDGLSGKKAPPDPNEKEPPGFGPELDARPPAKDKGARGHGGPLFAVIPSVFVMGPLALLAALFPAVFGGLAVFMKRWLVLLSVACTNSTLYTLHLLLRGYWQGSWWGTNAALWTSMTLVTLLGAVWSGWRYRRLIQAGESDAGLPRRGERLVLGGLSLLGLGVVLYCWLSGGAASVLAAPWNQLLVFWVGAWVGTAYLAYLHLAGKRGLLAAPALPTELIVLWAMVFACTNLGILEAAGTQHGSAFGAGAENHAGRAVKAQGVVWTFDAGSGSVVSSPVVAGDRLYVGVVQGAGLSTLGVVYCLDRDTRNVLWKFDDDGEMKQIFSTPCLADGRLFIGEGLHEDGGCKFYCLEADTGKKLWEFKAASHTESSPCAADGKVFVGAGDDGVYAFDAAKGTKLWQFQPGLHVDASPIVADGRLYVGSGTSRTHKITEVFSLNTDTGEAVWRTPVDLPVWGSPTLDGDHLFVGLGNGRFNSSADMPAGAVMCLEAKTGRRLWRYDLGEAVLVKPAVDAHRVYVGARDRFVYCLDRHAGRLLWKQDLGSPVVSSPRLATCSRCGGSTSLFAIASGGRVCALDPSTGQVQWDYDVGRASGMTAQLYSSPAVIVRRDENGERRRLFIGAGLRNAITGTGWVYCLEDRIDDR